MCVSPEQDFSPQVVADTIEVLLIEQDFTDGPVEGAVRQVLQHVFPARQRWAQWCWGLCEWCCHGDWPEAFVLCDDAGPSALLPRPAGLPTTEPAGVHEAQHPAGLLVGIEAKVGMLGQLVLTRQPEISRHPKAKDYVHGLVRLILTLHGSQGELHFLPSGGGCDAISLAGEGHVGALADSWFSDRSGENQAVAHFVHIKAGQVELWTLGHFCTNQRGCNCRNQISREITMFQGQGQLGKIKTDFISCKWNHSALQITMYLAWTG